MAVPLESLIFPNDQKFRFYFVDEIYNGLDGHPGRNVPNINDLIVDYVNGFRRVVDVDTTTGLSTTEFWKPPAGPDLGLEDLLIGSGPGTVAESYRAFIDTSVLPFTMALDSRLHMYGTTVQYVKVFLGTDINQLTGTVVSTYYNQSGQLVGENIPMDLVYIPVGQNLAIKTPKVGNCNRMLDNGELLTVVAYDAVGGVRSQAPVLVKNTQFARTLEADAKYVIGIYLKSGFISTTDDHLLEYPANITNISAHIMGVVQYSNGTELEFAIDGNKFALHGIDGYIPTVVGQYVPLVLSYRLSVNEFSNGIPEMGNRTISVNYQLTTIAANGAYSVKLFTFPKWIDAVHGYRLEYWLYNLDRQEYFYATPFVHLAESSPAFDPINYGVVQHLSLVCNLQTVDSSFADYNHLQTVTVTLLTRGDLQTVPNWTIQFSSGQSPQYGVTNVANITYVDINHSNFDITCGATTKAEWLARTYYAAQPMFNVTTELEPPVPNIVKLGLATREVEITVDQWNASLSIANDLLQGQLLYLRFIKRTSTDDLQLAVAAIPAHLS